MDISKIIADLKFNADATAIKNAEEALKQLDKQLDTTEEGTLAWGEAMRKTEAIEKALGRETKKLDNSIEGLEQSIEDLRKAQRKLDLSTEQGKKKFSDYEKQIKSKQGTINNFKGDLEDTTKTSKGFGNGIASMAKVAIPALAATFAVEKLQQFGQFILETEKKYTGLTNQIQRASGLQAASLDKVVVQSSALADKFGVDTNELINSVKSFANAMEIDFTEALNLAEKGFLAGANANGDFLSLMNEYPVQFKAAKQSGEEFVQFATQGALTGSAFGADKLLDAVKEIGLRLRELDKAQIDALQPLGANFVNQVQADLQKGEKSVITIFKEIVDRGKEVGLSVQQNQKLIADLGGGALEDLGGLEKAYKLITDAQNLNLDSLDKLGQKQKEELERAKELAKEEQRLANTFKGLSEEIDKLTTEGKSKLLRFFNDVSEELNLFNTRTERLAKTYSDAFQTKSPEEVKGRLEELRKTYARLNTDIDKLKKVLSDTNFYQVEKLFTYNNQLSSAQENAERIAREIAILEGFTGKQAKTQEEVNKTVDTNNKLTPEQIKNIQKLKSEIEGVIENWQILRRQTAVDLLPQSETSFNLQFAIDTDKLIQDFEKDIKDFKEKSRQAGLSEIEIQAGINIRRDILNNQIEKADKDLNKNLEKIQLDLEQKRSELEQARLRRIISINDRILANQELTETEKLALVSQNTQSELAELDLLEEAARANIQATIEDERLKNLALEQLDIDFQEKREATYQATSDTVKQIRLDEFQATKTLIEDSLSLEEEQLREKFLLARQEVARFSEDSKKRQEIEKDYSNQLREIRRQSYLDLIKQLELENQAVETSTEQRLKNEIEIQRLKNAIREADVENTEKTEQDKKEILNTTISSVLDATKSIADAITALIDLQIARYERSKKAQEERVRDAEKIAEKGNAALLEAEQKRLDELEAKQERAAQRQQAIAAGQALAGAIAGIAQGAAQGGVVGIAAVIAGLAAGIVAVTQLVQGAFADGVVDFKGKGDARSDSNLVLISNGESVITASGTDKAPVALKMINEGLLTDRQIFAQTTSYTANISPVQTLDMGALEERLERLENSMIEVNNSIRALKFNVSSNITREGVFKITTEQKLKEDKINSKR